MPHERFERPMLVTFHVFYTEFHSPLSEIVLIDLSIFNILPVAIDFHRVKTATCELKF